MAVTCPGHCCAAFSLPFTPTELALRFTRLVDGTMVAAMAIPLTHEQAVERNRANGGQTDIAPAANWYTCRYWDEETKLCRNYEGRPAMCSEYPYGKKCEHGCGLATGKPQDGRRSLRRKRKKVAE